MMRRTQRQRWYHLLILVLCGFLLISCGGGGGGPLADGGVGGTGIVASGNVTGLGSILVNGVHYRVAGARFDREGEAPLEFLTETQNEIRVGMVVVVDGELDANRSDGQAIAISYTDVLEGPVDAVTTLDGQVKVLTILNQEVIVEAGFTQYQGITFAGLDAYGGILEVSGFRRTDGSVQATYLETRNPGQLEIQGKVTATAVNSFNIGTLNVLFAGPPTIAIGDLVEVKGSSYIAPNLVAATVEKITPGLGAGVTTEAQIEGFVDSELVAAGDPVSVNSTFTVEGQDVIYTATTRFDGGAATDLVRGTKVEVEGSLSGGVLSASKIIFKEGVRLEGDVDLIVLANGTLTLKGLTGVNVIVDPDTTELNGITALADLSPNDHIRVRGKVTAVHGTVLATRLDLRSASPDVLLRGPVEDDPIVFNQVTILGLSVDTTSLPDPGGFFVEEDNGSSTVTDRTTFFGGLAPLEVVKLTGTLSGSVNWETAEKQNALQ